MKTSKAVDFMRQVRIACPWKYVGDDRLAVLLRNRPGLLRGAHFIQGYVEQQHVDTCLT